MGTDVQALQQGPESPSRRCRDPRRLAAVGAAKKDHLPSEHVIREIADYERTVVAPEAIIEDGGAADLFQSMNQISAVARQRRRG